MKVLVTRPEPGASRTAKRLLELGFEPVVLPCLTIIPRLSELPERPQAIVITSAQAIPMLPPGYRHIPVFCVGHATAAKLKEAGFLIVESAAADSEALFRLIAARRVAGAHLLAVGARHGLMLARQMRAAGIPVNRRTVYTTRPLRMMPPEVRNALAACEIERILFYSADTAKAFIRLQPPQTATIEGLALSPAIADVLKSLPWRAIHVALAPAEADLLALLK